MEAGVGTFIADVSLLQRETLICAAVGMDSDYMPSLQFPSL